MEAGATRPASEWAICAGEPCDDSADLDVFHEADDGSRDWLPLCRSHYDRAPLDGLEYIVERHGFIRGRSDA